MGANGFWTASHKVGLLITRLLNTASTKLSQVKSELQEGLAILVRKEVHAATSSSSTASHQVQAQDERIAKLEVGLQEVRMQNTKFEEWFQTLGTQMQQQATQVNEVQQTVAAQQTALQAVPTDVASAITQAMSTLQRDMQQQLATQTSQFEAMLSKKHRTE